MKRTLLAALFCIPAVLFAAEAPKAIDGYLPTDRFVKGANVKVMPSENLPTAIKPLQEALSKADKELIQDIQKIAKPDEPIPFDERLKVSKEDYDKYIKAWNERKFVPVEEVGARLKEAADGKWEISAVSVTNNAPLPLSCLAYDGKKDVWTSPNGELVRKDDVKLSKMNLMGELKGSQWVFEDKSSMGTVVEKFVMAKEEGSNDIFLIYQLVEAAANNQITFQNMYVIRIDAKDMKEDPLKKAAREKAEAAGKKK